MLLALSCFKTIFFCGKFSMLFLSYPLTPTTVWETHCMCCLFARLINFTSAYLANVTRILGLPRCKNLARFSLFVIFCFAVRYSLKCFCFLCLTSSVSFTGSYTEVKPEFCFSFLFLWSCLIICSTG